MNMCQVLIVEFKWVIDRLREKRFRIANEIADILISIWRTGQTTMTVYGQMTNSLRSNIEKVETSIIDEEEYDI